MAVREHVATTWRALKRWFIAQLQDALCVGVLWFVGLLMIGVPFAPLWAVLGALLQFVPHIGTVLSLIGPAFAAVFSAGWTQMVYVLILYSFIVVLDGIVFQPLLMKRNAKVPLWASILVPLGAGLFFNVWGVLLAPPLLAVIYTFREKKRINRSPHG